MIELAEQRVRTSPGKLGELPRVGAMVALPRENSLLTASIILSVVAVLLEITDVLCPLALVTLTFAGACMADGCGWNRLLACIQARTGSKESTSTWIAAC